jgi:SIR2-like domain
MSAKQNLSPFEWQLLLDAVGEGRCVPVFGAAANVSDPSRGYVGLPLGADVARRLAEQLWPDDEELREGRVTPDLAEVALAFRVQSDRPYLLAQLRKLLSDEDHEPSPLLRTLAALPIELVMTTNYDRLLERALEETKREYLVCVQPIAGFDPAALRQMEQALIDGRGKLVVYKIHGTIDQEVLIDEDDYIDFMGVVGSAEGIPKTIIYKLVDSTLLCIGYSVKDWDFRLLYRQIPRRAMRRSFVILRESPSSFWADYLTGLGFVFCSMDVYDFADELRARWRDVLDAADR